jgi:putative hemolysin
VSINLSANNKHIVDILIEERAPKLAASPFWPIIKPTLNALLGYKKAVEMVDFVKSKSGQEALLYVSELLHLQNTIIGFENLPRGGRLIVVANHPTGIADGIALFDAIREIREDILFYANADAAPVVAITLLRLLPLQVVLERYRRFARYSARSLQPAL